MGKTLRNPVPDHWSSFYVGLNPDDLIDAERPSGCWELLRHVYRTERGVTLSSHSAGNGWRLINPSEAQEFDLVAFSQGGVTGHVGMIVGRPWQMLHLPESEDPEKPQLSRIERFDNGSFLPRLQGVYRRDAGVSALIPAAAPENGCVGLLGLPFINPCMVGEQGSVPEGKSLGELVAHLYPATSEDQRNRMRVSIGAAGQTFEEFEEQFDLTLVPAAGTVVAIEPLPGAIPWGKVVGLLALTAALALGQYYLAPLLPTAFAGTFGTLAIGTGLAAVSLILQGLQGTPGSKTDKQNYFATAWQNQARLNEVIPDPLGNTRDAPAYAAPPYISLGPGVPSQAYYWKYNWKSATGNTDPGSGNLRFSVAPASVSVSGSITIRVDDLDNLGHSRRTRLDDLGISASTYTLGVRFGALDFLTGTITSFSPQTGYTNIVITVTTVNHAVSFVDGDPCRLAIVSVPVDDNTSLYLHGVFLESVGNGVITSERFGDTDLADYDEDQGNPISVERDLISPGEVWPFTTYPHIVLATDPSTLGVVIENGRDDTDWIERITPRDITQIEPFLRFDAGLYNSNQSDGAAERCQVYFEWRYAPIGTTAWVTPAWHNVEEDRRAPFYRSDIWTVTRGTYRVQHRKTGHDDDYDRDSSQDGYTWVALQGHRPEAPVACRAPIKVTAFRVRSTNQLQGTIQAYNRIFSREALDWNGGAWVFRETANPAAALRYKLQSAALAVPYADADIDLDNLADWSEYCVTNGLKYHSTGAEDKTLLEHLSEIAFAGRARVRRYDGKWGVVVDQVQPLIKGHITPANSTAISVTTQRTPNANGFRCPFSDATSDYNAKTRIVPFPGLAEGDVSKPMELVLPGVTSPSQIYKEATRAYYQMFEMKLPRWSATAGWDHMTYGAGDRVLIDDGLLRTRVSAVVLLVSGNVVTLDQRVTMLAGHSYQIQFRHLPDAGSESPSSPPAETVTRTVVNVPGETDTLVLSGSGVIPDTDPPSLVIFSEVGAAGIDVIVDEIRAGDHLTGTLLLSPYTPTLDGLIAALTVPAWDGRVGATP